MQDSCRNHAVAMYVQKRKSQDVCCHMYTMYNNVYNH